MLDFLPGDVFEFVDAAVLTYFIALQVFYSVLVVLAVLEVARRQAQRLPELDTSVLIEESTPPVTILVPAYNEGKHVVETVRGLLRLNYSQLEVVVINDGSTDDTLDQLKDAFELKVSPRPVQQSIPTRRMRGLYHSQSEDRVWVVDKENGGKADALNAGINATQTPIFCAIDADTVVLSDALLRLTEPFIYGPEEVVAVGGTVRVGNGCDIEDGEVNEVAPPDNWWARFQNVEYLRAFIFGRLGFNRLGGNLIISGAFGLFSRRAVVEVGGYDTSTVGEDMELVVRLHRYASEQGGKVVQLAEPIAYTEVPEDLRGLAVQRARWHRGLAQTLWKHRAMIGRPRYGLAGMVLMPLFVLFELLGPVVEVLGYAWFVLAIALAFINPTFALLFFVVAFLWGAVLTVTSVVADLWTFRPEDRSRGGAKLVVVAILENFGYRQMTLLFRIRGLYDWLRGDQSWGQIERKGHGRRRVAAATEER